MASADRFTVSKNRDGEYEVIANPIYNYHIPTIVFASKKSKLARELAKELNSVVLDHLEAADNS